MWLNHWEVECYELSSCLDIFLAQYAVTEYYVLVSLLWLMLMPQFTQQT